MAEQLRVISTEGAPKAIGPYSQAIAVGDLVFCTGQVALEPASGTLVGADIAAQTARALDNLTAVLHAAGTDVQHVVKTTVFLVDMADFAAMNEVYQRRFGDHRPARSTVAVSGLPLGSRVEIECIAIRVK